MTKNFNVLFYIRKDKADDKGLAPIYCRITVDGKRAELAIKREIHPDKWEPTAKGYVKGNKEEAKSINAYIDAVKFKIHEHQKLLMDNNKPATAEAIKNSFLGISEKSRSVFKIFEEHNAKVKALVNKDFAPGTLDRYETCLKHLREFVMHRYKSQEFFIGGVDNEFIHEFDYYLRSTRNCANNTTFKYLKNFKKIIRLALANGWITTDPFLNYKVKLKKVDRGFLTEEEINTIAEKQFAMPRLNQVKDAFIFQCYTGLAFADIKLLTKANIVADANGEPWINTVRKKTGNQVNIPLLPQAIEILERYKEHPECINKGVLLPILSNQKYNSYLKEIADLCNITKNLSTHLGRHTFGTSVTLNNGISLEATSKMLGHSNINTTRIYARMMDTRVNDEMAALKNKMKLKIVKFA